MKIDTLATWHDLIRTRDGSRLDDLLADDVLFHSPVVHVPQSGKTIARQYLLAAFQVFLNDSFRYVRELRGPNDAALEFEVEIDGVMVNGIDLLHWNEQGQIDDFKVLVRPLKAINLIHQKMGELLAARRN